jgi:NodT family efflux transporter outer membrane factor (OMF) lipoprotein
MKTRVIALLLVSLAGCASAPPRQTVDLGVEIPGQWTVADSTLGLIDSLWRQEFADERLPLVLEEAFRNNRTLKLASANVRAATAQARIAGAPLYPQAGLSFNASRRKQNFIGLPVPGSADGVLSSTTSSFGVSLNLSWEIDLWGRIGAAKAAALAQLQAARADYRGARLSLAAQVCKAWFAAVEAQRQMELMEATLENQRLSYEQVGQRYRSGLVGSLDYRLSYANLARAEAALHQRRILLDRARRQLEVLLGRYPDASFDLSTDLPGLTTDVPAGVPADVLARRPDLVAAERRLAAAYAGVASSRAALYPSISLTGSTGRSSSELGDLLKGDFSVWNLVGNVLQPIFQGGRLRAGVELARSGADAALAQYGLAVLNACAEVEGALVSENLLRAREAALAIATEQSLAARTLAEDQYQSGLRDFLTMLEAQRSAYDNESLLLSVRRERLDARIDLYLALGGDFQLPLEREPESGDQP